MNEWPESKPIPVISAHLVQLLLARVHAFTTIGLEAQATAFSCGEDGVIKYLALLPQINDVCSVSDGPGSDLSAMNAIIQFQAQDKNTRLDDYSQRVWIHTHARHQAFMSHVDIYQMYRLEASGPSFSFSMVISPRFDGLKVLAVRLTEAGTKEIGRYITEYQTLEIKTETEKQYVEERINGSSTKFYYQVPFILSQDPSSVADFRETQDVLRNLRNCVVNGNADHYWLSRHWI